MTNSESAQHRREVREVEHEVCASLARGNISLQRGEYITAEDLDLLQDDLIRYFATEASAW